MKNYFICVPGCTLGSTDNQNGLSLTSAAKSIALDSTPAIFLGSKLATTITVLPIKSSGS